MRFACPWDRTLKLTTCAGVALLVAVGLLLALLPLLREGNRQALPFLEAIPVAILAVVAGSWLLGPRAVAVDGAAVRVERRLLPVVIPISSIRSVQLLPPGSLRGAVRTFGAGGFFGHFGRFWSRSLGTFRMYATSTRNLVLLDTDGGRFVLSPDPADGFAEAVRSRSGRA